MARRTPSGTSNAGSTRPGVGVHAAVAAVLPAVAGAGLRLFPLLCGLFALVLFWRVAALTLTGLAVPYADCAYLE